MATQTRLRQPQRPAPLTQPHRRHRVAASGHSRAISAATQDRQWHRHPRTDAPPVTWGLCGTFFGGALPPPEREIFVDLPCRWRAPVSCGRVCAHPAVALRLRRGLPATAPAGPSGNGGWPVPRFGASDKQTIRRECWRDCVAWLCCSIAYYTGVFLDI